MGGLAPKGIRLLCEQSFSRGENGEQTKPNFTAQNSEEKCRWFAGPIPCSFLFQSW